MTKAINVLVKFTIEIPENSSYEYIDLAIPLEKIDVLNLSNGLAARFTDAQVTEFEVLNPDDADWLRDFESLNDGFEQPEK